MKVLILILLVLSNNILENDISKINKLTKNAEKAFKEKNYKVAINDYNTLIDSFNISNEKIHLNLAHSYLLSNDTLKAIENYNMASITNNNKIKSIAYQQLGNINESKNKLKNAAEFYKKSILSNNSNLDSKYNYELVTKKLKEQEKKKEENKNQQNKEKNNKEKNNKEKNNKEKNNKEKNNKEQENKKKNNKEKNNKEQENKEQENKKKNNKEQEKSIEEKLKEVNMSKKKAEMILNALNNIEFQYIQQLKRKATKKIDKNKPDW
jgi:hypothetical protein